MLESFLHQCGIEILQNQGVIFTIFMAGLLGGFTHCSAMCAPFVIGQVTNRMDNIPLKSMNNFTRLKTSSLPPYHLGRMTTYTLLGAIASSFASPILAIPAMKYLSSLILSLAGLAILSSIFSSLPKLINLKNAKLSQAISNISRPLFKNPTGVRGYFLGICLGFIPCGLLFSVFMIVSTIRNPAVAAISMLIFCIATIPSLFFVAYGSSFIAHNSRNFLKKTARFLLIINSFYLFFIAYSIIS